MATRPLIAGRRVAERLAELLPERAAHYEEVCDVRVATDGRTPEDVAREVLAALSGRPA
jgi:shikimate kinase